MATPKKDDLDATKVVGYHYYEPDDAPQNNREAAAELSDLYDPRDW